MARCYRLWWLSLGTLALAACAVQRERGVSPRPEPALTEQGITGTPAPNVMHTGLVRIKGAAGGECSGKLLTRRWVATVAGCFCGSAADGGMDTADKLKVDTGTQTAGVTQLILHDKYDVALLRLDTLLPLEAPTTVWSPPVPWLPAKGTVSCLTHRGAPMQISGTMLDPIYASLSDTGPSCGSRERWGIELVVPDSTKLEDGDLGGPCFATVSGVEYFVGMISALASSPTRLQITGVDRYGTGWLPANTDIWPGDRCSADIPNTLFSLDPTLFAGLPDSSTFTLVAQKAHGDANDASAPQLFIGQTSDARAGAWTEIPSPTFNAGMIAASAAIDGGANPLGRPLLNVSYLNANHEPYFALYDATSHAWLQRTDYSAQSPLLPFDGIGQRYTTARPLLGQVLTSSMEPTVTPPPFMGFVSRNGELASSNSVERTTSSGKFYQWVDSNVGVPAVPADGVGDAKLPLADETKRLSLTERSTYAGLITFISAAFRNLSGQLITTGASALCQANSATQNPWCAGTKRQPIGVRADNPYTVVWDLPTSNVQDVAIGLTTQPPSPVLDVTYWVVTVEHGGTMRLWSLGNGTSGHATDYGLIGDHSMGMPKLALLQQANAKEELYVTYSSAKWSARVQPVGNCLANTPTWWAH